VPGSWEFTGLTILLRGTATKEGDSMRECMYA